MQIKEIKLKDFRNYEDLDLKFHKQVNIILGNNAQGKTNLLESVFMTSLGKSFRTGKDTDMIRFGCQFSKIKAVIEKEADLVPVEIILRPEGKSIKVGDVKIKKISELLENIYVVIFSPEDLKIVKEEPEKRRRFINREISQLKPLYYIKLSEYNKILKQRNAYLKEDNIDENILDVWNAKLVETGSYIINQREVFIEKLNKISREIHKNITDGKEELNLVYESNIDLSEENREKIFSDILYKNIKRDIFKRNTGRGPHRDDIKIDVNGIDIRSFGSQGQQRTAALSLKLAELKLIKEETGEDAILLLDDVLSELDLQRQNFLIHSLSQVQLFITTTELSENIKENLPPGKIVYVDKGKIKE